MPERFLDVSHEALIRGWPRLRRWLDEDRAGLRLQRRITETAEEWQRSNRDDDLLYRGARLIQAQEWRERHETELNPLEREFLDASMVMKQRVEEEKRLHEAESERMKLLLERRKRERIFGVTVFVFGLTILIAIAALSYGINQRRQLAEKNAADAEKERRALVEKGQKLRDNTKGVLVNRTNDPMKDVTALRNLSLALNLNRQDAEAAKMARDLLLQRVWCPPVAPEVRYRQDTFLAATFAPGGRNNEIFAVTGDGQLLFWNERNLSPVRSLFQKPKPDLHQVVQPGFVSFSPNGQWLFIIPPTLPSAAKAEEEAPKQGALPLSVPFRPGSGHELCKLQIWRWSMQHRTYESAGEDLEVQRLRGSRINFAWSNESDRLVLINTRLNEVECVFFQVKGNTFQQLVEESNKLNRMKIVALAFAKRPVPERRGNSIAGYEERSGIAAVSVDFAAPALRKVSFIDGDDLKVISGAMNGQDSILLSEDFQPNDVAFGPGNNQLTLTSWSGVRILDLVEGNVTPVPPPTFRDQFMRVVTGPGDFAKRLVATSLFSRVQVAKSTRMQEPAEPVVFRGAIGIAQFSPDGQRLLILSGGIWNVFDTMRLIDVSPLYRTREAAPENFEAKPAPPWLTDIASAVSALDTTGDGSLLTLETVRARYPKSKVGDAYEAVWKRFFPDEKSNERLKTGR
jgi:hypothetical protein